MKKVAVSLAFGLFLLANQAYAQGQLPSPLGDYGGFVSTPDQCMFFTDDGIKHRYIKSADFGTNVLDPAHGGTGVSMAGTADQVFAENHAGNGQEFKSVSGTGGIAVTGGSGTLVIDGSAVVGTNPGSGFTYNLVSGSSQTGAVNNAYKMTGATPTFTLPTAVGVAGKQILVINGTASSTTITYAATSAQTVNGAAASGKSNATGFAEDLFTSDGANWVAVHLTGL